MNAGYPLRGKVNDNAAGIISAADDQRVYAELLEAVLDPLIFVGVVILLILTLEWPASDPAREASIRLTLSALRWTTSSIFNEVIKAGIAVGYDDGINPLRHMPLGQCP